VPRVEVAVCVGEEEHRKIYREGRRRGVFVGRASVACGPGGC
jgi:hypothetical protein